MTVGAGTAVPDKAVVGEPGTAVGITPPDRDTAGRQVTVRRIGKPAHGTAVLNADGTITYTPDPGFTGTDSFTYEAVDEDGNVAQASIIVTVPAPSSPPVPAPSSAPPTSSPPARRRGHRRTTSAHPPPATAPPADRSALATDDRSPWWRATPWCSGRC